MSEPHDATDDEGIERDSCDYYPPPNHITLPQVLDICARHVSGPSRQSADQHYRAVCRALVAEALELATFLERVSTGSLGLGDRGGPKECRDLAQLNFQDWVSRKGPISIYVTRSALLKIHDINESN